MKNLKGSVSKTVHAFACALVLMAFSAGAVTVKDIGIKTHYPWNGLVDVTFAVDGVADGSVYHVSAKIVAGATTYEDVYVTNISANAGYAFTWDATAAGFKGRVEDAKVVFTVDEPNFAVIDLSEGPKATKYPVTYLSVADPTADAYKTDKLLLKRVGGNYVGVFEVTQRQFERVMGENPSYFSLLKDSDDVPDAAAVEAKRPVERVSYEKVAENGGFFDLICERTGLKLALPTEAEWTAAAKGNMPDDRYYNLGADNYKTITGKNTDSTWLPQMGRYVDLWNDGTKVANGNNNPNQYSGAEYGTAIVGSYLPNDNGLYDMHGNVAEWTLQDVKGKKVLRGGSWQSTDAQCSVDATWEYLTGDANSLYKAGFRVFGAEPDDSFEKQVVVESDTFPVDVDEDNIREVRVADNNDGTYAFYYTPQGGTERDWVTFDDAALFGGTDWKPAFHGINTATNAEDTAVIAKFNVAPLTMTVEAEGVTVTYDGEQHTITGPNVSVPSYHAGPYQLVYWCADKEGQSTRETASAVKPAFADVKYKTGAVSDYVIRYEISSPFYTTVTGSRNLRITPRDIEGAVITFGDTLTYNAKVQTNKVVSVTKKIDDPDKVLTLVEGTDFTVADNAKVDATTYTATLTGIGNYMGTATKQWEILPLDFGNITPEGGSGTQEKSGAKVNLFSERYNHPFVYNGRPQTNYVLSVSINGQDFGPSAATFAADQITGNVATDVGTYKVVVTGVKNFKGQLTNEWTIAPMPITNATVYLDAEFDYNGDCQTRNVTNVTVATDAYTIPASAPAVPAAIEIPSYTIDVPAKWYYVRGNTGTNASAKVGAYTLGVWAKSLEGNNFCSHVYTNWFIGQRDLTNATFRLETAKSFDYVYDRNPKTPTAVATDRTSEMNPTITPRDRVVAGVTNDWKIAEYIDNVDVESDSRVVFAATPNGNYRGVVTNDFKTKVLPAVITSVTITNEAAKVFVYDGTEKVVHRGDVLVTTANGLTLRNDAKPYEFKTAGENKATASGKYTVTVESQSPNFTNAVPAASDTWTIVPASPTLTWTTPKGATNVTDAAGTIVFGVSDLTVAAISKCAGETLHIEFAETNKQIVVKDNKFHVTERTKITVFSTFTAGDGTILTGAETTVTLVPGVCADPEIYIQDGWRVGGDKYKFDHNNSPVVIKPTDTVGGVKVREYPNDPFWPAWNNATSATRRVFYTLLDGMTNVIASAQDVDYATEGLKVSADTVFVVAQIRDTAEPQQYLDSIVVTQKLTRVIGELAAPVITIEKVNAATRRVTMTQAAGATIYYTTSNKVVNAESSECPEALKPTAACETGEVWAAEHAATTKYEGPFEVTLGQVDECVDVKAIAYTLVDDDKDFTARSPVADEKSFHEWHEGEALDAPDQVFTNGWSQLPVPKFDSEDPKADPIAFVSNDVPWFVAEKGTANECMRSGVLTNGNFRTSSMSTAVYGPGRVVFNWKPNCEDDPTGTEWDHGEFIIDGVITQRIDGVTNEWISVTNMLDNVGTKYVGGLAEHVLTWRYVKDFAKQGGIPEGEDCIYLDAFSFTPAPHMDVIEVKIDPLVFDGTEQSPVTNTVFGTNYIHAVIVNHPTHPEWNGFELAEGSDYSVVVDKKREAGTYSVTLTGINTSILVSGTVTTNWTIKPLGISAAVVEYDPTNTVYTGAEQIPAIEHVWAKHYLHTEPLDLAAETGSYTVTNALGGATKQVNKGAYKLKLVGGVNLTGETQAYDWSIQPKPLTADMVALDWTNKPYNREAQNPQVTVTATGPAVILPAEYATNFLNKADYSTDITNAAEKIVIVTAKDTGNWTGAITNSYWIDRAIVKSFVLTPPTTLVYTGGVQVVTGTVATAQGMVLNDAEWRILGNTATDVGVYTAKVEIVDTTNFRFNKGAGGQQVPLTKEWQISAKPIAGATIELGERQTYTGAPLVQTVTKVEVNVEGTMRTVPATDYMVESNVATNVKLDGDYVLQVTVTNGNYKGKASKAWNILPKSIAGATITFTTNLVWNGEAEWKFEGETFTRTITKDATVQTNAFGVTDYLTPIAFTTNLVKGVDYEVEGASDAGTAAGPYTLKVKGIGNYTNDVSKGWTIAPTIPLVRPNNANPTTNEVYVMNGQTRISVGADTNSWVIHCVKTTVSSGVSEVKEITRTKSTASAAFTLDGTKRTKVEVWTYVKGHADIQSDHVFVDYRTGRAAEPVIVLADKDNIPNLYEDGTPFTNEVGAVITNFTNNGQHIALTRGNVAVSNGVGGVRVVFTNDAENAIYADGTLRYTLDGTIPTEDSSVWTAGSEIEIDRTTKVIAKVFGSEYADSLPVTNKFVRKTGFYAKPKIEYVEEGSSPENWLEAAHNAEVTFEKVGQKVRVSDPLAQGGIIYFTLDGGVTTNKCAAGVTVTNLVFNKTTEVRTWIADELDPHNCDPSDVVKVLFSCDTKFATPVVAFSNATEVVAYQKDAKTFTNAWQWIQITRGGDTFTRYTDGEIYYKLDDATTWTSYAAPFKVWTNVTVCAQVKGGISGFDPSDVATNKFVQEMAVLAAPTVTVEPTMTVKQVKFTITRNAGNIVYYTTDGSDPIGLDRTLAKSANSFTDETKTLVLDIKLHETNTVKAIAYDEIASGTDFIGRSAIASCTTNRAWRIGDALRPGVDEEPGSTPSTADLDAHSEIGDGYNHIWTDDDGNPFDTSWVEDAEVAYAAGGKSMRSGDVRFVAAVGYTDGTNSVMTAKVYGPGTFRFCWKASTEFDPDDYNLVYDVCRLSVDGVDTGYYTYGSNDWAWVEYTIEEEDESTQEHVIMWNYIKDDDQYDPEYIGFDYEDCVWVDEFTWTARPMMDQCDVVPEKLTYNKAEQFPTFYVTNRATGVALVGGVDYVVATNKQTDANSYVATLKGLGTSYTGSNTVTWTIDPLSLSNAVVTLSAQEKTYEREGGVAKKQYVTVDSIKAGPAELEVLDVATWSVSGTNGDIVAKYTVTVSGSDNLCGSVETNWCIKAKAVTAAMIAVPTDIVYFGGETNVETSADWSVTDDGANVAYTIDAGNFGTNAGTYKVAITTTDANYTGSATQEWTIAQFDFDQYAATPVLTNSATAYTGLEQTNGVRWVDATHPVFGDIVFSNDTWWVSNNVQTAAGDYYVYLYPNEESSNFTGGPISNVWTIDVAPISEATVTLKPFKTFTGYGIVQEIEKVSVEGIGDLTEGDDYTVSGNSGNVHAGNYELTVTGINSFAGTSKKVAYKILPAQITDTVITLTDATYTYDGQAHTPAIKMMLGTFEVQAVAEPTVGTKIGGYEASGDTTATNAGTNTITLAGYYVESRASKYKGNIAGTTNIEWVIEKRDFALPTIEVGNRVYDRTATNVNYTVTDGSPSIIAETDYTVAWDARNTGTAGVYQVVFTPTETGNYTGAVRTVEYKITPAEITEMKFNAQPGVQTKLVYNGANQSVKPAYVKATGEGGTILTLNASEYAISNSNGTNVATYESTVSAISPNFSAPTELKDTWWIVERDISDPQYVSEVVVKLDETKPIVYTGSAQKLSDLNRISLVTANPGNLSIDDYTLENEEGTDAKGYTATLKAKSPFTGSKSIDWTIAARDIKNAKFTFEKDRLEWTGGELTPKIASITFTDVGSGETITLNGDKLNGLTVDNAAKTDAGFYESTISGTGNFTGTTDAKMSWGIVPGTPKITPNDGAGTYTKLADWVTVEINNTPDDAPWTLWYTTNDTDWVVYPTKGGKFDITQHMVVKARAVSVDGCITGATSQCEYFFGARNKAPTIGLTALEGAEKGRPASYEGTEVKGEAKLVVKGTDMVTNFYHNGTKVYLTRFGTMNTDEIAQAIEDTKTAQGDSPLTDGKIYYTIALGEGATVYAPDTNDTVNTKWFNPADNTTWPTFDTNAVIVAQVFGDQLESSKPVTNSFQRLFAQIPAPTIKPDDLDFHFCLTNSIVTNAYVGADWTVTNELQKIFITLDETDPTVSATRFLYTNEFEVTWANTNAEGKVVVKAVATREGEGYQNSSVVTKEYQFLTDRFAAPTMTPATTFRHWKSEDPSKPNGFQVSVTNNAPIGVGGTLMYSLNGVTYPTVGDVETYSDIYLLNTTTVRVWVATTDAAHNYKPSLTNETIFTYDPYKMVAPTNDTPSQTFSTDTITFTVSNLTAVASVEDHAHIYNGTLMYSYDQGGTWRAAAGNSMTVTTNETTEIWIKQVREDHLDSDIVVNKYTRNVVAPTFKLLKWDSDELAETNLVNGVTNFYHNSRLQIIHPDGTTLTYTSDIPGYESGTYTGPIPVKDTFTLTAKATTKGGSKSEEVTVHYNRVWDTLAKAKVELVRPQDGVLTNEFRNTADSLAITNGLADVESRIVLWPTNFVVKYAIVPNSTDTNNIPDESAFTPFEQGVTKAYFKADTNVVWAIATADDYLPSTNAVKFIRVLDPIEKPTITFDNSVNRTNVTVTIDQPAGSTVYYTYAITNVAADVADPVGYEYDYTKCTNKYAGAFDVVLKPDQTLVVKARAYVEDGTSSFVEGFTETNFTARSKVACEAFTLPWTIGDALDAPDQAFEAYSEPYKASNTNVVEDTETKNYGDSSMVFKDLADGEWASIETTVSGPGTVIFDWKTRCESKQQAWRDHFVFSIDGDTDEGSECLRIDGDTDWQTVTNYIGGFSGQSHTLVWRYRKDASEKKLDDSAWLDHFRWIPSDEGIDIDEELDDWLQETAGADYWNVLCPGGSYDYSACTTYLGYTADNGRSYYECYLLGLAVDDPDSEFEAVNPEFEFEDDPRNPGQKVMTKVTLSWTPITMPNRVYSLVGMKDISTDEAWTILNEKTFDVPAAGSAEEADRKISATTSYIEGYHFFEIRVRMAK